MEEQSLPPPPPIPQQRLLLTPSDIPCDADGSLPWWKPKFADVARWLGWRWLYLIPLGLLLLFPFVLVRSLGAGDWKFAGALGAFLGPIRMLNVLVITIMIAGLMALGVIIWTKRIRQTAHNVWQILKAYLALQLPGQEFSLDNPEAAKVPFGVAMALAVIFYMAAVRWGGL